MFFFFSLPLIKIAIFFIHLHSQNTHISLTLSHPPTPNHPCHVFLFLFSLFPSSRLLHIEHIWLNHQVGSSLKTFLDCHLLRLRAARIALNDSLRVAERVDARALIKLSELLSIFFYPTQFSCRMFVARPRSAFTADHQPMRIIKN